MSFLRPLRGRPFRRFFVGMTLSRAGDAMGVVALIWVTLQQFGPALVGLVLLVSALPTLVAAPAAGVVIERLGLRRAVVLDNLIRCAAALALATVLWAGVASMPVLLGYAVLAGLTGPITEVAVDTATPEVVADEDLDGANILLSLVWDLSDLTGPLAAGLLIDALGVPVVFALDALTFLVMAVLVPDVPISDAPIQRSPAPRLSSGFRLLFSTYRASLWLTLISVFMLGLAGAQKVIYPVLVSQHLGGDASAYGLLVSICGAASLLGTLLIAPRVTWWRPHHTLAAAIALRGTFLLPLGLTRSYPVAAGAAATSTLADGPFFPVCRTVQQRLVPIRDRARVTGARSAFAVLGYPLGNAVGGLLLAAHLPTGTILIFLGALHLIPVIALLTSPALEALPRRATPG